VALPLSEVALTVRVRAAQEAVAVRAPAVRRIVTVLDPLLPSRTDFGGESDLVPSSKLAELARRTTLVPGVPLTLTLRPLLIRLFWLEPRIFTEVLEDEVDAPLEGSA
jgi:hypothetical protein